MLVIIKSGLNKPYKTGPNKGFAGKYHNYSINGLTVSAVQGVDGKWAVVYSSTEVKPGLDEKSAKKLAQTIITSGASTISEMRAVEVSQ